MRAVFVLAATLLLLAAPLRAQDPPGTDILLMALPQQQGEPFALDARNVTNRPGYDNQPVFTRDGKGLLYTSIRDGQADIYHFDLASTARTNLTKTPESEYSPTPLPEGRFSVVRVEADGTQRLWQFDEDGEQPRLLLEAIQPVGYHAWGDAHTVALFVLGEPHFLLLADTRSGKADTVAFDVGRSLHRVPGRRAVSFVQKSESEAWEIRAVDLDTRTVETLAPTLPNREDYAWTPDGTLLMADGPVLYFRRPADDAWRRLASFSSAGFTEITRLAVSPAGDRLALVVDR